MANYADVEKHIKLKVNITVLKRNPLVALHLQLQTFMSLDQLKKKLFNKSKLKNEMCFEVLKLI